MPAGLSHPALPLPRVCFLLLCGFPWLESREPQAWVPRDCPGGGGALELGGAIGAAGRGGHDPDNPLPYCHKQDSRAPGQRRWRSPEKGKVCGGEGVGGWRGREAGRPGGSLLPTMTRTPFFLVPCFRVCFIPIPPWFAPSSALPLHPAVFPSPACVAKHGHAICKGVAMHFPK